MPADESCAGYVNWDSFYVGSMLANTEWMYRRTLEVVGDSPTLTVAAAQVKEAWNDFDWDSEELDLAKVDWEDVAEAFFDEDDDPPGGPPEGEHDQLDDEWNSNPPSYGS